MTPAAKDDQRRAYEVVGAIVRSFRFIDQSPNQAGSRTGPPLRLYVTVDVTVRATWKRQFRSRDFRRLVVTCCQSVWRTSRRFVQLCPSSLRQPPPEQQRCRIRLPVRSRVYERRDPFICDSIYICQLRRRSILGYAFAPHLLNAFLLYTISQPQLNFSSAPYGLSSSLVW